MTDDLVNLTAEITRLRAQVEAADRLAEALLTIRDDRRMCPRAVDCVHIARAALTTYQKKREGGE